MSHSQNEVMGLAAKAARGGGAPPEQAVLFGRAAYCHLAADRTPKDLIEALKLLPGGPILELPPLFLASQEKALDGQQEEVAADHYATGLVDSYAEAQAFLTSFDQAQGLLHTDLSQPAPRLPVLRVSLPEDLAELMRDLAARILVPESEASRLSGAGAGLTDND